MTSQDKSRAYAALHEDRVNGWISQAEYEAELRKLNGGTKTWLIVQIAILIALYIIWRLL